MSRRRRTFHRTLHPTALRWPPISFAHPSEATLASLLSLYGWRWEYEPREFALEFDDDQRVRRAFRPDFYLPELDLFLELTVSRQSLVTKKNAKVRRTRELYPEIRVEVLYRRDFEALVSRHGLTGTEAEEKPAA